MVDNNLYEDCKKLSRKVYPENRHIDSNGWQYKESYSNNHNGFFAEIYTKNNKLV